MTTATTLLHIHGQTPDEVERALETIFADEDRARVLRLQGSYSAVLARLVSDELQAGYRYLVLRPSTGSAWTPLLELGNRTEGLDRALSDALGGAAVFSIFVYGDAVSGYRMVRGGAEVDQYLSDPEYVASLATEEAGEETFATAASAPASEAEVEVERGHPERFADLLPAGTSPEDFARIVLRPGWWEEHAPGLATAAASAAGENLADETAEPADEELVDEADRARCIGLALELFGPREYPFAGELEEIANAQVGPAVALAFE